MDCKDKQIEFTKSGDAKLPAFSPSELHNASAVVWNGQSAAITSRFGGEKVVILVTATLIDPAGNPIHAEAEESPFIEPKQVQQ